MCVFVFVFVNFFLGVENFFLSLCLGDDARVDHSAAVLVGPEDGPHWRSIGINLT